MEMRICMAVAGALALMLSGCSGSDEFADLSVEDLKEKWHEENGKCRGLSLEDPNQQLGCDRREKIGEILASSGWCYTSGEQASYLSTWRSCNEASDAANSQNTVSTPVPVLPDDAFIVTKKRKPNFSELEMTVAVDSVTVNDIKVNKGNCLRSYVYGSGSKFPMDLKFGDKIYMGVFCDPIRLDFDTSSGGWWYQWS